jgi:predicted DNA-binding antitoxin AbrB/MazE fold protein
VNAYNGYWSCYAGVLKDMLMTGHVIIATFVDGVLKPEQEIALPPGTRVRLILDLCEELRSPGSTASAELDRLCDEFPIASNAPRLTRDELHARH